MYFLIFFVFFIQINGAKYDLSGNRSEITISGEGSIDKGYLDNLAISKTLISCTIKDSIMEIPPLCFEQYSFLQTCTLPCTLRRIGEKAFFKCYKLESLIIPEGVSSIPSQTLMYTQRLREISFPSTLVNFDTNFSFYQNSKMSRFRVAENNSVFSTDENGKFLMDKSKKILYSSVTVDTIEIPDTIENIATKFIYERNLIKTIIFSNEKKLHRIEYEAFRYAYGLTSLSLPEGLEFLGAKFAISAPLESISLPSTLSSISTDSFSGLKVLKNIYIAPNNNYLYSDGCAIYDKNKTVLYFISDTKNITIPSTVKSIPQTLLQYTASLENVTILGDGEFKDYENLVYKNNFKYLFACPGNRTVAKIHEKCEIIKLTAFSECSIKEVIFESNNILNTLETSSFANSQIEKISLPDSVHTIFGYSFQGCKSLKSIKMPKNLSSLMGNVFSYAGLESINFSMCTNLLSIGPECFSENYNLTEITLPPKLGTIENSAFRLCSSISRVSFPSSIVNLRAKCFRDCTQLAIVTFESDSKIELIDEAAFANTALTSFTLPNNCKTLGESAFSQCTKLENITIEPESELKTLMAKAFEGTKISSIQFGKDLETITPTAFTGATLLFNVTFVESNDHFIGEDGVVYTHNASAVVACTNGRKEVFVKDEAESIWDSAFYQSPNLKSVTFTSSSRMRVICRSTFVKCSRLTEIWFPSSLCEIEGLAFQDCTGLKNVTIERGSVLSKIGDSAFFGCQKLETFRFMSVSKVSHVGSEAFSGCPLTDFDFSSIASLGAKAFSGTKMESVRLPRTALAVGASAFADSPLLVAASVWAVGADCFKNCPRLKELEYCVTAVPEVEFLGGNTRVEGFVPLAFPANSIEGIPVVKVFDGDCQVSTAAFSVSLGVDKFTFEMITLLVEQSTEGGY